MQTRYCDFPCPEAAEGATKNTMQLAKYPLLLPGAWLLLICQTIKKGIYYSTILPFSSISASSV